MEENVKEIKKGLLKWYEFKKTAKALYIGDKEDPISEVLFEELSDVKFASLEDIKENAWRAENLGVYDYVILIQKLELESNPKEILTFIRQIISNNGTLLLGMNNRFGIRYFCGDRDPYTGRNFDGIEGYSRAYVKQEDVFKGRMYTKVELIRFLKEAGWSHTHFYSILPGLDDPNLIYEENFLPNEDLANRLFPMYHSPDTIFLEEETLYNSIIESGMFHQMANAYFIECKLQNDFSDVLHVTSSMSRGEEDAMLTIIRNTGIVEKIAINKKGYKRLESLIVNANALKKQGIKVVDAKIDNNRYYMPYIEAEVGQVYLKKLIQTDQKLFLEKLDQFRDLILQSSEIEKEDVGDGEGAILTKGYFDMVPLNSFYMEGDFVFYDQEFCEEHYPANIIIARMISTLYAGNLLFHKIIPIQKLYERYGLDKNADVWIKKEGDFLVKLRKEVELKSYFQEHRRKLETIHANRQSMNYSINQYIHLFVDIFQNADTRKLILFGSGEFTKKFLELYQVDYPVYAIIDNNKEKWGKTISGIKISSPDILKDLKKGECKVLICIKNYLSVMKQMEDLKISEFSIYNAYIDYPRKQKVISNQIKVKQEKEKQYNIGYIAGVFDLFHIGHLNMLKNAKEYCNYLIVGVVSDERTKRMKGSKPFIPFEERAEIVRSCRYVDQVIEIPDNYGNSRDVYRLFHFDCQFSGSDYENHPGWQEEKEFLEKHGADLVFFPYTEHTSSTKIKELIRQKLV